MNLEREQIHLEAIAPQEFAGLRLDQVLASLFPQHSRARLQTFIKSQQVSVDGKFGLRPRDKVKGGEKIVIIALAPPQPTTWHAQDLPLNIIHEDDALIILNKPVGMVVHPGAGNREGTLVNALLHHCPSLNHIPRAGIIHRLDKDTSGLLVIAKTLEAHTFLVKQMQKRRIKRMYYAVVNGIITSGGTIDAPLGRHPIKRKRMAVVENGRMAISHYRVLERFRNHTLLTVQLETGRTHQIRVHMAHIKHSIVGDVTYGKRVQLPKKASPELIACLRNIHHQTLHAYQLGLIHPFTKIYVEWTTPMPEAIEKLLTVLREH
jgi:23S rRNA pseudouridine1911/1915/1917 synthase